MSHIQFCPFFSVRHPTPLYVAPSTSVRRPRLWLNPDPKSTASLPQSWPQFKSPPHRRAPHQITAAPQRLAPAPIHRRAASAAARTRSRATDAPQLQDCPREISRRGGRGAIVPGVPSSPIPSSMEMTTSTIFAGASIWAPSDANVDAPSNAAASSDSDGPSDAAAYPLISRGTP